MRHNSLGCLTAVYGCQFRMLDSSAAVYIAAGLFGFLVVLWCLAVCVCRGPCQSFHRPVKSPLEAHLDPATREAAMNIKYALYYYHLMVSLTSADYKCTLCATHSEYVLNVVVIIHKLVVRQQLTCMLFRVMYVSILIAAFLASSVIRVTTTSAWKKKSYNNKPPDATTCRLYFKRKFISCCRGFLPSLHKKNVSFLQNWGGSFHCNDGLIWTLIP